jgi:hypothetical protein
MVRLLLAMRSGWRMQLGGQSESCEIPSPSRGLVLKALSLSLSSLCGLRTKFNKPGTVRGLTGAPDPSPWIISIDGGVAAAAAMTSSTAVARPLSAGC